jgi:hypothetical protein
VELQARLLRGTPRHVGQPPRRVRVLPRPLKLEGRAWGLGLLGKGLG